MPGLRLAILDVDGTLKEAESPYQYLHVHLGVAHLAAENRALALAGQIGKKGAGFMAFANLNPAGVDGLQRASAALPLKEAVAQQRLIIGTSEGALYCFGQESGNSPR